MGEKTKHNITSDMSKNNAIKTVPLFSYLKYIHNAIIFVNRNVEHAFT